MCVCIHIYNKPLTPIMVWYPLLFSTTALYHTYTHETCIHNLFKPLRHDLTRSKAGQEGGGGGGSGVVTEWKKMQRTKEDVKKSARQRKALSPVSNSLETVQPPSRRTLFSKTHACLLKYPNGLIHL